MTQKYMREIVGGDINGRYTDAKCRGHFDDWVLPEIESATPNECQIISFGSLYEMVGFVIKFY